MPVFRPGIRKVKIYPVYLPLLKHIADILRIHPYKTNIKFFTLFCPLVHFLYGAQEYGRILFNSQVICLRIFLCHIHYKPALPHSDFQAYGKVISENLLPHTLLRSLIMNNEIAFCYDIS